MAETTPSQQQYPNLNPYSNSNGHTSDSKMESLTNGPIAEKARTEAANTKNELSNLAAARTTPSNTTATGQKLTHYHSFFYELLSWSNPRATSIAYATVVTLIFATRYVPLVRYLLKGVYMILGITAAAEIAGKLVFGEGFATKIRPNRYYTIPRETLESIMEDLVELGNFFVIEFQRIVFAESIEVTVGTFLTALLTYFLTKITPAWGLGLLFTTFVFFTPLLYIKNQVVIERHLSNAHEIINQQATQVRDLAQQHTSKAMEASQSALKDYSAKASEMMGGAKKAAVEKGVVSQETADKLPGNGTASSTTFPPDVKKEDPPASSTTFASDVKKEDFPTAPQTELEDAKTLNGNLEGKEPLLA